MVWFFFGCFLQLGRFWLMVFQRNNGMILNRGRNKVGQYCGGMLGLGRKIFVFRFFSFLQKKINIRDFIFLFLSLERLLKIFYCYKNLI